MSLRAALGGPLRVLLVAPDPAALAPALALAGVDEVLAVRAPQAGFDPALQEEAAFGAAVHAEPALVLVGHSSSGMSYAAGLAVRLGAGFAADVFAVTADAQGLLATRGAYGAKVNAALRFADKAVVVLTLRGATFAPPPPGAQPPVTPLALDVGAVAGCCEHLEYIEAPASGIDIGKAECILAIGRGIGDEKNVARFAELAQRLGVQLGCSRPLADAGWLHKAHQVGLTGKVAASCRLYLALGISGAVQHLHGMKHVETIIAINTDAQAPIFNVATVGATLDVLAFADALEALL